MIVLDASAVVEALIRGSAANAVADEIKQAGDLHAPHLIDVEVSHVLRRAALKGEMSSARGLQAIDDLAALRIVRHRHDIFLRLMWSLRENMTAYDAVYVALAETLDAPLLTRDRRLAEAARAFIAIRLV